MRDKKKKSAVVAGVFDNPKTFPERLRHRDPRLLDAIAVASVFNAEKLGEVLREDLPLINEQGFGKVVKTLCHLVPPKVAAQALQILLREAVAKLKERP